MIGYKIKTSRQGLGRYKTDDEAAKTAYKALSSVYTKDDFECLTNALSHFGRSSLKNKIVEHLDNEDCEDI